MEFAARRQFDRRGKMKGLLTKVKSFLKEEDGPTATEYAVMLALIIIVALAAIGALGSKVDAIFTDVESEIESATGV